MWFGQGYCRIVLVEALCEFMKVGELKLPSSCPHAGICYREKAICGLRFKLYVDVQSIALSAPFGELMVSVPVNVPQTS